MVSRAKQSDWHTFERSPSRERMLEVVRRKRKEDTRYRWRLLATKTMLGQRIYAVQYQHMGDE